MQFRTQDLTQLPLIPTSGCDPISGMTHSEAQAQSTPSRTLTAPSRRAHRRNRGPAGLTFGSVFLTVCAASLVAGCASSGEEKQSALAVKYTGPNGPVPHDPMKRQDDRKIGFVLATINRHLQSWMKLALTGRQSKDGQRIDGMEDSITYEVQNHFDAIVYQLETGAPLNRQIAAAALGFSENENALGPLLIALRDEDPQIVSNALLGLSILGHENTPVAEIAAKLSDREQPAGVRQNACRALRSLPLGNLEGDRYDMVQKAARFALSDDEELLRANGALILAELGDLGSIDRISNNLQDASTFVIRASSRSLARLGSIDDGSKGRVTRALVGSLKKSDAREVRPSLLMDLQRLSNRNYGDDFDAWAEYAANLP